MPDFEARDLENSFSSETPEQAASRIIRDAAPFAAQAISEMATDDTVAASVRLRAATYIIDRNLGPVGGQGDREDALEQFLKQLNVEANEGRS